MLPLELKGTCNTNSTPHLWIRAQIWIPGFRAASVYCHQHASIRPVTKVVQTKAQWLPRGHLISYSQSSEKPHCEDETKPQAHWIAVHRLSICFQINSLLCASATGTLKVAPSDI